MQKYAFVFVACVIPLAGCNANQPATTVAALESALTAADQVALVYVTKPQCGKPGDIDGITCSNGATIALIKQYAQKAHDAVVAAEASVKAGATPDIAAANAAIAALQAAFPVATATTPTTK